MEFYNLYYFISYKIFINRNKSKLHRYFLSLHWKLIKEIFNLSILITNCYLPKSVKIRDKKEDFVVSLTTFPKRIDSLHVVIKIILNQTYPPSKILLWLSEEEFPKKLESLPNSLKKLLKYDILEIKFVSGNLKSHKKYFYAFQEYSDKNIITVDDDIIYYPDTFERLFTINKIFPDSICANAAKEILIQENAFLPYKKWKLIRSNEIYSSHKLIAIGYGAILYPKGCFNIDKLIDLDQIKKSCLHGDDLWLKINALLNNKTIATGGKFFPIPLTIPSSQKFGLRNKNVGGNENDIQWNKLNKAFNLIQYFK